MTEVDRTGDTACKVLLVEPGDASLLTLPLTKTPFFQVVGSPKDIAQALQYFDETGNPRPDLVIVDLPESEVKEFVDRVQAQPQPPIIIHFSGLTAPWDYLRAFKTGPACVLGKLQTLGDREAFVKWLEDWMRAFKGPAAAMMKPLFKVAGRAVALNHVAVGLGK